MEYPPAIIPVLVMLLVTRPLTVLLHELGHAVPALLFSRSAVTIYIGSFEETSHSKPVKIGRLTCWFRRNPLQWWWGLCEADCGSMSVARQVIYVSGGALVSLFFALVMLFLLFSAPLPTMLQFFCTLLFTSALFDILFNFNPFLKRTQAGQTYYSDGRTLIQLLRLKKSVKAYDTALQLYRDKQYEQAAGLFERLLKRGWTNEETYRLAGTAFLFCRQYIKVIEIYHALQNRCPLNADDWYCLGMAYLQLAQDEEAEYCLEQSLTLQPENPYALNAFGYLLTTQESFEQAIPWLNKAIALDHNYSYAYNNRGYALMQTGQLEEGLADVQHSIQLDRDNSYAWRNLGIYYLLKNQPEKAKEWLLKSREMDPGTPLLGELLKQCSGFKGVL